ncbi:MAG: hypothetical protein NPIRA01_40930 [Nitrospirales bacterium]|nr:MAG: hypothetical protein NPIRA01_40930 [Nitrospirales bacterium]
MQTMNEGMGMSYVLEQKLLWNYYSEAKQVPVESPPLIEYKNTLRTDKSVLARLEINEKLKNYSQLNRHAIGVLTETEKYERPRERIISRILYPMTTNSPRLFQPDGNIEAGQKQRGLTFNLNLRRFLIKRRGR